MKKHPIYSQRLLSKLSMPSRIQKMVRQHHESFDGTGYPDGLKKDSIQMGARILAVIDTYDALISERPHRKALERRKALEILNGLSGEKFDPAVVSSLPLAIIRSLCDDTIQFED